MNKEQRVRMPVWRQKAGGISSKLKYIGLLGVPIFISDWMVWKYLWQFWFFAVIELLLNVPVAKQIFKQLAAMPYGAVKYRLAPPNINTHQSDIRYALPFSGAWTVVNGDVNKARSHSWSLLSQRYAYDFLMLDSEGQSHCGDAKQVENYYCYGQPVLASADGVVIEAVDRFEDSLVDAKGTVYCGAGDLRGNYILVRHAEHAYSLVGHLKPGSILVAPGDEVKQGAVMAQCGNTGNTSQPHIHFQVQDGPAPFAAASLPIAFQGIDVRAADHYERIDPRPLKPSPLPVHEGRQYIQRGNVVCNGLLRSEEGR